MENVKNGIGGCLDTVANGFTKLWEWLKDILDNIKNGFKDLGQNILDMIKSIKDIPQAISDLLDTLFNKLFVPDKTPLDDIKSKFDNKFPIINQVSQLVKDLFNYSDTDSMQSFTITYKGQTHTIINFEPFLPYRQTVKVIISLISWLYFVFWCLKFIPKMLGGIN